MFLHVKTNKSTLVPLWSWDRVMSPVAVSTLGPSPLLVRMRVALPSGRMGR